MAAEPSATPRQLLGTQTRGTSRGKNDPRGCMGIAGWCLQVPAGTTQTGTPLTTMGQGDCGCWVSGSDLDHNPCRVGTESPSSTIRAPQNCPLPYLCPLIPPLGSRAVCDHPYQLNVVALISSPQTNPTAASGLFCSVLKPQAAHHAHGVQSFVLHHAGTRAPGNRGDAAAPIHTKGGTWERGPTCSENTSASSNNIQNNLNSGLQPVLSLVKMRMKR